MSELNKSCYVLLGLLSKQSRSGYALKEHLKRMSDFFWSESNAQIYPNLKKLETLGLVSSQIDPKSGARQKREYALTSKGKEALLEWLSQDCEVTVLRENILLHLSLGQHLNHEDLYQKILHYKHCVQDKLKRLDVILAHVHEEHLKEADYDYLLLAFSHVQCVLQAKIHWCDQYLEKFKMA